ncbi:hypothetical protein STEG23_030573 [Scotinomys teguina]
MDALALKDNKSHVRVEYDTQILAFPTYGHHRFQLEVPSAVTQVPDPKTTANASQSPEPKIMELSDSDRPISFGSTSSSASSRDSHGSFGSRMTLVSNSHLGLFHQDKEAGAIKLELVPARPFSSSELQRDNPSGPQNMDGVSERQPRTPWRVDTNGTPQPNADSDTSPKLLYVDRVVQEILETEKTYVQDLKSIVEHTRLLNSTPGISGYLSASGTEGNEGGRYRKHLDE